MKSRLYIHGLAVWRRVIVIMSGILSDVVRKVCLWAEHKPRLSTTWALSVQRDDGTRKS